MGTCKDVPVLAVVFCVLIATAIIVALLYTIQAYYPSEN